MLHLTFPVAAPPLPDRWGVADIKNRTLPFDWSWAARQATDAMFAVRTGMIPMLKRV